MFESLIGFVAIIGLIVVMVRQHSRIRLIEREVGALRSYVLSMEQGTAPAVQPAARQQATDIAGLPAEDAAGAPPEPAVEGPWSGSGEAPEGADGQIPAEAAMAEPVSVDAERPAAAAAPAMDTVSAALRKPDIETALGTRWAVWVGGIALALGGVFLIRYSIEAGIFGPEVRLLMAALLGLVLAGGGEFLRRTGFKVPVEGMQNAYVPAILTAAGAFTLFGTVYSAHAVYGFIGPGPAFVLLGLIGIATVASALVHGQALGGIGVVGSYVTPILVASSAPNHWALFGFLAIVLAAAGAIARLRNWTPLMTAALVGPGVWLLLYLTDAGAVNFWIVLFIDAVMLAVLAGIWLRGRGDLSGFDVPSIAPAVFVALSAAMLAIDPGLTGRAGLLYATLILIAMLAVATWRAPAIALLFGSGVAVLLVHARMVFAGSYRLEFPGGGLTVDGMPAMPAADGSVLYGTLMAVAFLAAGLFGALRHAARSEDWRAPSWSAWAALAPLVIVFALWISFGNIDRDLGYALAALVLAGVLIAGGELIARAEPQPLTGGTAVSLALIGGGIAAVLMLHMAFGGALTTILAGVLAILPALATRFRSYPVLGWLSVGAAFVVLGRVAFDPTIVGASSLSTTPFFNQLLAGYGIPTLAFAFAAWQLARTTAGRPRLVMEAFAALFALLTVAILVRHAMNGGVLSGDGPTLGEQAIYTLIAIGGGAILIALDARAPSPVFRHGSMALGVLSVAFIAIQHFLVLNPLYTEESTGRIPVVNLLLLGYLMPAAAMGALAWYARGKRPQSYVAALALVGALLAFAYATLSVRRLFHGEFIGLWKGLGQLETYSYSALWLAMGVALLAAGVRLNSYILRVASAALVVIAVAKVFLFDMSELEGVLRALSFIGLGAVLIGIGLFYQRMLTAAARRAAVEG